MEQAVHLGAAAAGPAGPGCCHCSSRGEALGGVAGAFRLQGVCAPAAGRGGAAQGGLLHLRPLDAGAFRPPQLLLCSPARLPLLSVTEQVLLWTPPGPSPLLCATPDGKQRPGGPRGRAVSGAAGRRPGGERAACKEACRATRSGTGGGFRPLGAGHGGAPGAAGRKPLGACVRAQLRAQAAEGTGS